MPCIASSFWSAHKPCGSCNAIKSREWLNLIYKIAGGLSCRTDNVCSWHGHGTMSVLSPRSPVKRKLDFGAVRSAFDPQQSFGLCRVTVWRLFVCGGCGSQQKPRGDFPSRDFCYSGS